MSEEKRYRTEIPNIIDDLGLDPHERALYVHYKRACGGNGCEWVESIRITAQKTKMSFGRASEARKSLVERGLIRLIPRGNDGTAVRIMDIWDLNSIFFQDDSRPDVDGWSIKQLREWYQGVHNTNTIKDECSDSEGLEAESTYHPNGSVHNVNTGVHNTNKKKEPKESLPKGNSDLRSLAPAEDKIIDKGPKTIIKEAFMDASKLTWPGLKKEQSFWWSQFGEIARIFESDSDRAAQAVKSVIDYMRRQGLSVTSPKSIVNLCRQVAGGQPLSGGRDSPEFNGLVSLKITGSIKEGFNL